MRGPNDNSSVLHRLPEACPLAGRQHGVRAGDRWMDMVNKLDGVDRGGDPPLLWDRHDRAAIVETSLDLQLIERARGKMPEKHMRPLPPIHMYGAPASGACATERHH